MSCCFRCVLFGVLAAGSALDLHAQVIVGSLPVPPNVASLSPLQTISYVDLSHPATADGEVNSATFIWSAAPCAAAAKIKFFRKISTDFDVTTLRLLAERGPFDVGFVTQAVSLSPPVTLQKGDLIGITNTNSCGTATFRGSGGVGAFTALILGDAEGDVIFSIKPERSFGVAPELRATAAAFQTVVNILPVAISAPGAAGSYFKTRLQLRNPQGVGRLSGKFVFHSAFAPASPDDPSLPYSLGGWETQTIDDLVAAMGQTGIGSVDVVATDTDLGPTIQATIYTETPAGGTLGCAEPTVRPAETGFFSATLIGPDDPSRVRMNIGVRVLDRGATIRVVVFDSTGTALWSETKTYPPNYFEQLPASAFMGGVPLGPNMSFVFNGGNAIVYGVTADNQSQSVVIRFAKPDL
jgi:hypothetical protein